MSTSQRARSGVPLDQRSALASVPGVPAWGAVAIAVGATFLGVVIDAARGTELTSAFACLYLIGVVAAVVLVRYRGLFTASVQAPLILFVAVPVAYQYFTENAGTSLKDILLNVAIPLVNRFPLMLLGSILALAVAAVRIFLKKQATHAPAGATTRTVRDRAKETRDRAKQNRERMRENRDRGDETRGRRPAAETRATDLDVPSRSRRDDRAPVETGRRARRERETNERRNRDTRARDTRARDTRDAPPGENRQAYGEPRARGTDRERTPAPYTNTPPRSQPPRSQPPRSQPPRSQPPRAPRPPQVDPYSAPRAGAHIPPHPVPQVRYRDRGDA